MPTGDASSLKEKLRKLPQKPGVYLMKDRLGGILYVGKARNLKRRVTTYFQPSRKQKQQQPKVLAMLDLIHDFEIVEVRNEAEALLLESRLIKHWKPRYNTELVDDKRYPMVRVDVESVMPRFRTTRLKTSERSRYYGPFAFTGQLRKTLLNMRLRFGILLGDASPTLLPDGNWKLYDDVRAELYGHANVVSVEEYRARVEEATAFLDGHSREWLEQIRVQMSEAAEKRDYEAAAHFRDLAKAVEQTLEPARRFQVLPQSASPAAEGLALLRDALSLRDVPHRMECFDISHISGSFCVASMVSFSEGVPDKRNYRRFKIRTFIGNDDFRSMEEVVGRRYSGLLEKGMPFPDLLVIDGGMGQIASALRAFIEMGAEPPPMIGLAKKHERIFFSDEREPLDLPPDNEGRKLLQRIRDEAHRFANTFNADLRSKRIRECVLDDFQGIGPARKTALLEHFKSVSAIREADADAVAASGKMSLKMAEELLAFLRGE